MSSTSHQHRKLCTGESVSKALRDGEKFVVIDQGWSCHSIEISAHELHILLADERANFDNVLKSAWTKEGWVDHVKTVRRGHDEHAVPGFGTVHEGQQQRRDRFVMNSDSDPSRRRPKASNSSKNITTGARSSASSNNRETFRSLSRPTLTADRRIARA